ncbi:hypothetical protein D3C86_2082030 [compost metagenome]
MKNDNFPKCGSTKVLKMNSLVGPVGVIGTSLSLSDFSGGISTAEGATLSIKPINRPLPMFFLPARQKTGNT